MQWIVFLLMIVQHGYNCVKAHERVPPGISPQHYQQAAQQGSNPHQNPHYQVPQHQIPQHQVPQHQVPQHQIPQQQVPQHQVPQQQVPQHQVPQHQVPQHQVPQHQVPQHQVPQHQLPQQPIQHQIPTNQFQPQPSHQPLQGQNVPPISDTQHAINHQIPESHGHHHGQPQILNTENMAHEKEHIAEHLGLPVDTSKMSEQELQFHYFKMHDADNNNKLDGCELIKSLIHWHEEGNKDDNNNQGQKIFTDEELMNLIDPILDMDDTNKDGFIDYPEFIQAQQKAASATGRQ